MILGKKNFEGNFFIGPFESPKTIIQIEDINSVFEKLVIFVLCHL